MSTTVDVFRTAQLDGIYAVGVDTAEGLDHGDASCVQVLDCRSGEQVAVLHGRIPPDELAECVKDIGLYYNRALVGVESNNHGLTTITVLRQLGYPNLYRRRQLNSTQLRGGVEFGWKTTSSSKPLMIDDLDAALRNGEIIIRDKATIAEMRAYARDEKGRMGGSPHDDRVMALAVAQQMRKYVRDPHHASDPTPYMTLDWWAQQIDGGTLPRDPTVIGAYSVRQGLGRV